MTTEQLVKVLDGIRGWGTCRSCHQRIAWFHTYPGGKAMPFNGDPVPRKSENVDGALVLSLPASASHWASCPQAKAWKKK